MQGIIIENIANLYRVKPIHQNEEKMSQENPEPVEKRFMRQRQEVNLRKKR